MSSIAGTSAEYQEALLGRRLALEREIEAALAGRRDARQDRGTREVHDAKDDADSLQASATSDAELERDREELGRVNAALARFDAGSYGLCSACGEPIDPARLKAEPACLRCLACQARYEGHR